MIRVFIVDDHLVVRQGLKKIMEDAPDIECVGEAANGDEALSRTRNLAWDVMLLDISMPEKSGGEVLKQVMAANQHAKVLILSMYEEDERAVRLMKAGASGYLTKDIAQEQLLDAIRLVANGRKYISPALGELLLQESGSDTGKPLHSMLSDREYQIFTAIGSGKTVSEIADALSLSVKTVSTHRAHILEKMNLKNNAEITYYVMHHGLLR